MKRIRCRISRRNSSGRSGRCARCKSLLRDVTAELAACSGALRRDLNGRDCRSWRRTSGRFARHVSGQCAGRYEWNSAARRVSRRDFRSSRPALGDLAKELEGLGRRGGCCELRAARAERWQRAWELWARCPRNLGCAGWRRRAMGFRCTSRRSRSRIGCVRTSTRGPAPGCSPRQRWPSVMTSATFANRVGLPDARTLHIDSPFDYRDQARIYLPRKHARSAAPGLRGPIHRCLRAVARGQRRPGVSALHQLSRAGRGRGGVEGALSPRRRFRCWCRARRRARPCSRGFANWAMRCCSRRAASGRASTSRAKHCRSSPSTSCHSHRRTIRC